MCMYTWESEEWVSFFGEKEVIYVCMTCGRNYEYVHVIENIQVRFKNSHIPPTFQAYKG